MFIRYILSLFLMVFCFGFLFTACEGPPDDAIMDAEDAIKAAIEAGAEDSSPKLLEKAQVRLQDAKMFSEQGRYKEARKKAESSVVMSQSAMKNAQRIAATEAEPAEPGAESAPADTEAAKEAEVETEAETAPAEEGK